MSRGRGSHQKDSTTQLVTHNKHSFITNVVETMARGKQNQSQQKDGKHRKETKEERKIRIEEQQRAREVSVESYYLRA